MAYVKDVKEGFVLWDRLGGVDLESEKPEQN